MVNKFICSAARFHKIGFSCNSSLTTKNGTEFLTFVLGFVSNTRVTLDSTLAHYNNCHAEHMEENFLPPLHGVDQNATIWNHLIAPINPSHVMVVRTHQSWSFLWFLRFPINFSSFCHSTSLYGWQQQNHFGVIIFSNNQRALFATATHPLDTTISLIYCGTPSLCFRTVPVPQPPTATNKK